MGYSAKKEYFPVHMDEYLFDAIEIDDALADSYGTMVIGGIMEHIGVYFGDSSQLKDL
ncbi:hypothetical protein C5167_039923 [Papaver somniferum]|uniref:Uncharacterized protein n=1 Tax=Papaver somniferum TaxID=3469 RepID=A0A4Y7IDJ2_PAPSO|nr:hypothetical protein C5167_039923 [Papaver somniferum]